MLYRIIVKLLIERERRCREKISIRRGCVCLIFCVRFSLNFYFHCVRWSMAHLLFVKRIVIDIGGLSICIVARITKQYILVWALDLTVFGCMMNVCVVTGFAGSITWMCHQHLRRSCNSDVHNSRLFFETVCLINFSCYIIWWLTDRELLSIKRHLLEGWLKFLWA